MAACKEYSVPLPNDWAESRIQLRLSLPTIPLDRSVRFAHHAFDAHTMTAKRTVLAIGTGCAVVSQDLGETWEVHRIEGHSHSRFINGFCLRDGGYVLQEQGFDPRRSDIDQSSAGRVFILDADLNLVAMAQPGRERWHSPSSIDEAHGVLMYAEYPLNADYAIDPSERSTSSVHRSRDGGRTWETVLTLGAETVRHFHVLRADPNVKNAWWLFSGDMVPEARVFFSADNGDTWADVTTRFRSADGAADLPIKAFKTTDVHLLPDRMLWGTDDIHGHLDRSSLDLPVAGRTGSHLYAAEYLPEGTVHDLGYIGQPVRSMVPVGEYLFLITQSYWADHWLRPAVYLARLDGVGGILRLVDIDRYEPGLTGFTYSMASRLPHGGTFFTYRNRADVFPQADPRLLRWDVELD